MARRSVEIALAVDKWYMGWGDMSMGWDLRDFPLVLLSFLQKV